MSVKRTILAAVLAVSGAAYIHAADHSTPGAASEVRGARPTHPPLPVIAERYYRMTAKVRPLLFWIGRENVGGARIGWLADGAGARGFELLIGSDPARAPRRINRWGYIAEAVRPGSATTLGVMKQSAEQTIEDAKASVEHASASHVFKAIRATAANGEATAAVLTLHSDTDLTFRDVDTLLSLVGRSRTASTRTVALRQGTRPGFLVALADLMTNPPLKSVPYVYNGRFHTLRRTEVAPASMEIDGVSYRNLARGRFETENQATRERTDFEITWATSGDLAHVPVHVVYRPRWWFQVELFLDTDASGL